MTYECVQFLNCYISCNRGAQQRYTRNGILLEIVFRNIYFTFDELLPVDN